MDPLTLGLGAFSGLMSLFGGGAQAQQAADQAQQARINAGVAQTRGVEMGEQAQAQLNQTWSNISAMQSERGVDDTSPTSMALYNKAQTVIDRNSQIERAGATAQAGADMSQAAGYQTTSNWAIPLGAAQGALTFGKAWQQAGV